MSYLDLKLKTPEVFEGTRPNSKVLIISNGNSTAGIVDKKNILKKFFDAIIVVNLGLKYFDDISDFHIVCEKISDTSDNKVFPELNAGKYRLDVPRLFNWKGIEYYDPKYNIHKITRNRFDGNPDIRHYRKGNSEGLLIGPASSNNLSLGSVTLSSMHFACMLGASEVYLIGADMMFKDESDHFYPDRAYRDGQKQTKAKNKNHVVEVELNGRTYQSTDYFRDSAKCIDDMIVGPFKDVKVYDFSAGLITKAIPLKVDDFFVDKSVR